MSTDDNRALAQRFYEEVWNKGNLDAVAELLTNDFVDHAAPPGSMSFAWRAGNWPNTGRNLICWACCNSSAWFRRLAKPEASAYRKRRNHK